MRVLRNKDRCDYYYYCGGRMRGEILRPRAREEDGSVVSLVAAVHGGIGIFLFFAAILRLRVVEKPFTLL